jgi:hypothetical protein
MCQPGRALVVLGQKLHRNFLAVLAALFRVIQSSTNRRFESKPEQPNGGRNCSTRGMFLMTASASVVYESSQITPSDQRRSRRVAMRLCRTEDCNRVAVGGFCERHRRRYARSLRLGIDDAGDRHEDGLGKTPGVSVYRSKPSDDSLLYLRGAVSADAYRTVVVEIDQTESPPRLVRDTEKSEMITTAAGNGSDGFNCNGGFATGARLAYAAGVAVSGCGSLFIADTANHRIRKVEA